MVRAKTYITLLASAARTSTTTVDQSTLPAKVYDSFRKYRTEIGYFETQCAHIILSVSALSAGSLTVTISGKDIASGNFYTILAGSAVSSTGTTVYKIGLAFTGVPNLTANDFLPGSWKIEVAHSTGDSITYSLGIWLYG